MDILGPVPSTCLDQALSWSAVNLPAKYRYIIKDYKEQGEKYQVRWDLAFAQACHETGIFQFGGDVQLEQNNFAGIGATGNGVPGDSFPTISAGVLGQIQHLACYAGTDIPQSELVAPRTKLVKADILGKSKTWEGLTGTWAADREYFDRIQYHYRRIFQPRQQQPGWYRLVEQNQKKFFVAMSGDTPVFKYAVADNTLSALQKACSSLLTALPSALTVHSDKPMDVAEIPDYQPGDTDTVDSDQSNPWNSLPSAEPAYFWQHSPNYSARDHEITHIILHNTDGAFLGAVSWLCNPEAHASAHLVIPRSGGKIAALVNEKDAAWHAGSHQWNHCSLGIEIEATAQHPGMTEVQEKLLVQQLNHLLIKYNLTPDKIDIHRRVCRTPTPSCPTNQGVQDTNCPVRIWETDDDFRAWRRKWYRV